MNLSPRPTPHSTSLATAPQRCASWRSSSSSEKNSPDHAPVHHPALKGGGAAPKPPPLFRLVIPSKRSESRTCFSWGARTDQEKPQRPIISTTPSPPVL